MPRMIPASFVRLFQLALAQVHRKMFMRHFGWAVEKVLHTPIQVVAEQQGVDVSVAVATNIQIRVFNEDTRMGFDTITSDLDTVEVAGYVRQAQEFQGSGLFMFVLNRAVQHVEERKKRQNCFAVHQTDRL